MATYKLIGKRYLRKYTAQALTPVYAAATDAERVAASLCDVPWEAVGTRQAVMPAHGDDDAPKSRDAYDAALFCGEHADDKHRAYANAAVYRYVLPDAAVGATLSSLAVKVTSDPYNSGGVRLHVFTNSTGVVPAACADIRGNGADGQPLADGTTAAGVVPRETKTVSGKEYWYPVTATETLSPTGGLALQKYLFLSVVLEDYSTTRGNWLEGSAFIDNAVSLTTAAAVSGWTDGETYDLSAASATSFAVVEGGVMAALPTNSVSPIRSLTIQRTGDDFIPKHYVSDADLLSRDRVEGIRLANVGSNSLSFLSAISSGAAKKVSVFPSVQPLSTSGATYAYAFSLIYGDFADGTFSDLPGLFICRDSASGASVIRSSATLASIADSASASTIASLVSYAQSDGGIAASFCLAASVGATVSVNIAIFTRGQSGLPYHYHLWNSTEVGFLKITFEGETPITASTSGKLQTGSNISADEEMVFQAVGKSTYSSINQTDACRVWHYKPGKFFNLAYNSSNRVSYIGTVTAWRPIFIDNSCYNLLVSGDFTSFGGKSCKNCAIVSFPATTTGTISVTIPACDAYITPDDYTDFAVSAPLSWTQDSSTFYITGAFHSLGGKSVEVAAKWQNGAVIPLAVPAGARPPEFFLKTLTSGTADGAIWVDDSGTVNVPESTDAYAAPKTAVTDAQSAFGLRRLYAELYDDIPASATLPDVRPGAAFMVRGETITVKTGTDTTASAKCWNLSEAALAVPFSCPRDYAASKVKLEWGKTAATDGSCVRVWLKRGEYMKTMPTSIPKGLHFAAAQGEKVDGWEFVGTVTPTNNTAGEATLDISPLTNDTATLLFVAFIGQDEFNPSADMTLPRGVGTLNVNEVAGTLSGLDGGFKPDITLIG